MIEDELRERIERLETRQATDDASLLILNRYWNQVNWLSSDMRTKHCCVLFNSDQKIDILCHSLSLSQFDENVQLIIRRYEQASSEPEKSPAGEGRSLKPETPEPDGDSNQERAKDRGQDSYDTKIKNVQMIIQQTRHKHQHPLFYFCCHQGHQGETANSFLATLASSSSEEMEAELQVRVESSQKQAHRVVEICEGLRRTVDQLKTEVDSGTGEIKEGEYGKMGRIGKVRLCVHTPEM